MTAKRLQASRYHSITTRNNPPNIMLVPISIETNQAEKFQREEVWSDALASISEGQERLEVPHKNALDIFERYQLPKSQRPSLCVSFTVGHECVSTSKMLVLVCHHYASSHGNLWWPCSEQLTACSLSLIIRIMSSRCFLACAVGSLPRVLTSIHESVSIPSPWVHW